jgi:hypothetical protein
VPLRKALAALLSLLACAAPIPACLSPTEITLDVRTDVPCTNAASWRGVAISVGEPGVDVESRAPVLTTTACSASGQVGTLVVVPTGADNAEVGIRVVAGITENPEDCAAGGYVGCIVSRRTLSYLPHQAQQVVIDLTSDCIGNACDINHTCVNGSCTDIVTATAPIAPDGGVYDPGPTVRCGDDGTRCPANDASSVCCVTFDLTAGTGKGACVAPSACPSTSALLYCDDTSDCPPQDGDLFLCCEQHAATAMGPISSAACESREACGSNGGAITLCQDRMACPVSTNDCVAAASAPGYFDCQSD